MDSAAWTLRDWILVVTSICQAAAVFTAVFLYIHQRRTILKSEKQANRSRLAEAYMRLHAETIRTHENAELAGRMLRRGYRYLLTNGEDVIAEPMARKVHFLCLLLNALFLEWAYCQTYEGSLDGFYRTLDSALSGLATHTQPEYRIIADNFDSVFSDYPPDFRNAILVKFNEYQSRPQHV